jgi:membrane protein YdbS with pleckstrin-like domain
MQTNRHNDQQPKQQGPTNRPAPQAEKAKPSTSAASSTATAQADREVTVGVWRGSKANLQFWLKTILTLSLYYWFVYRHDSITLTTRRVTQVRGNILTTNETSMSIGNITNVDVNVSLLGRIFNYGDLSIQSAGSDATEIQFIRLANPVRLRELIFDVKDGRYDETK